MAITLRPIEQTADKWAKRSSAAAPEYTAGVSAPRKDWAQETGAAQTQYDQGVTEAIGARRFSINARKAGSAKWQAKASTLGSQRFGAGVAAAKGDYSSGFAPYASVLSALSLSQRGARGSASNMQRVTEVANALRAKKIAGGS